MSDTSLLQLKDDKRVYILDTNVLLHDPSAIFRFDEHIILIPLSVIDEIDGKKSDPIIGYNAREISSKLGQLINRRPEDKIEIPIPNGKKGFILLIHGYVSNNFPKELSLTYKDNIILSQIIGLKEAFRTESSSLLPKTVTCVLKVLLLKLIPKIINMIKFPMNTWQAFSSH